MSHFEKNWILTRLPRSESATLLKLSTEVEMARGDVLHEAGGMVTNVYFPLAGMVSLVTIMTEGQEVENGIVGRDGQIGGSIGSGGSTSFVQAVVQIPGVSLRVPTVPRAVSGKH